MIRWRDEELVYRIASIIVEQKYRFEWAFQGLPVEKSDLVCPIDPRAPSARTPACPSTRGGALLQGARLPGLSA